MSDPLSPCLPIHPLPSEPARSPFFSPLLASEEMSKCLICTEVTLDGAVCVAPLCRRFSLKLAGLPAGHQSEWHLHNATTEEYLRHLTAEKLVPFSAECTYGATSVASIRKCPGIACEQ